MNQASATQGVVNYSFTYQPILKVDRSQYGTELLFAHNPSDLFGSQMFAASKHSASLVVDAFLHTGIDFIFDKGKNFVQVDEELLLSDMVMMLPRDHVVLELPGSMPVNLQIIERCQILKAIGYKICLHDFYIKEQIFPLLSVADFANISLHNHELSSIQSMAKTLKRWPLTLVAGNVDSENQFEVTVNAGFDLFQGYFFAQPETAIGVRADPSRLAVLALLGELNRDANDIVIEDTFQRNPGLTFHILRLINSAALGLTKKVGSIRMAMAILGRRQLIRWLQLLLFALGNEETNRSALMGLAARRGKLMELTIKHSTHQLGSLQDRAFMVGVFSLLESIFPMPMQEMVEFLGLDQEVCNALVNRSGTLGKLLELCELLEDGDFEKAEEKSSELRIPFSFVMKAQIGSAIWLNKL